ncbi:MAG: 50S ribosomal protein L10 [Chloroflexota bacterium]
MPLTRARKEELVAQYVDLLDQSNGFVVIQFKGLTTKETEQLRTKIRGAEGAYVVAKNTLFTKALQQQGWPVPDDLLKGPTAVAFGLENMPGVAKAVLEFTQDRLFEERTQVKGGVMTGSILTAQQVDAVSKLPTLDELRSQLAGLIVSPAQGLVNVLYQATGQVVNVLQAYVDKHSEEGGEAA